MHVNKMKITKQNTSTHLLRILLACNLCHSVRRFDLIIWQIDQEEVQRLNGTLEILVFIDCLLHKSRPKQKHTRELQQHPCAMVTTMPDFVFTFLSPLLKLAIDPCVTVFQVLHLVLLAADVGTILIEILLQRVARLLCQVQFFA